MTQNEPAAQPQPPGIPALIRQNPRLAAGLGAGIIFATTLLAYVPTMRGKFIWDDDYHVTENRLLRSWDGLQRIWFEVWPNPKDYPLPQYYPMTHSSFWLEYRLWGLKPAGYHIVNVLLHAGSALMIWLILKKLDVPGAWLAGVIFALHPINVESVAWIAERKNVLSVFFFLCSVYVYLRYIGLIRPPANSIPALTLPAEPQRVYALAFVFFLCAVLSKTITSSMPAVVLLLIWWKRGRVTVKDVLPLLPLFAIGIAAGALTAYMERVRVGVAARPAEWDYAPTLLGEFGARCIIAGKAIWFYVGKLLWPHPLVFNYPRWQIDPTKWVQFIPLACAIAAVVVLVLSRKRTGRGPLVAALYYLGTLFPAMGFVDVWPMRYSFVADHFVYLSSIGLIALAAAIAARYVKFDVLAGAAMVVLLLFFRVTWVQGAMYADEQTLWAETWKRSGRQSWIAANNYGVILRKQALEQRNPGKLEAAEQWFTKVIELRPTHAEARFNLARIAEARGDLPQAERWHRQALELQPNYVDAHFALGQLLMLQNKVDEAEEHFRRCVEIFPRHDLAHVALASIAEKRGRNKDAIEHYLKAIDANSELVIAHKNLGTLLLQEGRLSEGLACWDEAMRLAPRDANLPNEFGARMAASDEWHKAADYFRRARQIDPRFAEAIMNHGVVAARLGFTVEAEKCFEDALRIDPNLTKARENLEALKAGRLLPATRAATQAATAPSTQPAQ